MDLHCEEKQDASVHSSFTTQAHPCLGTAFWQKPHSTFVTILVGASQETFCIHRDVLCAQSPFFREEFGSELSCEFPKTDVDVFGCLQSFIYTGQVMNCEDFSVLFGAWELAKLLKMAPFQTHLLNYIDVCRRQMASIPSLQIITEAWEVTEAGCPFRIRLIEWMAEDMRDDNGAAKLSKGLSKQILSELCMFMARLPENLTPSRAEVQPAKKRKRHSFDDDEYKPDIPSEEKQALKRGCVGEVKDLDFCRATIAKLLSPGYWARFAKPFKHPVDPNLEGIPNYFDVIKRPMDLTTIKAKMDGNKYANATEFEADIRQIFKNCYTYWEKTDAMYTLCKDYEKAFDNKVWKDCENRM